MNPALISPASRAKSFDEAELALWDLYYQKAIKRDKDLAQTWLAGIDSSLIPVGLIAASVTALVVESQKRLQPDASVQILAVLVHISSQLESISNSSRPAVVLPTFDTKTSDVLSNLLFFMCLGICLWCALMATMAREWIHGYLEESETGSWKKRGRTRAFLYQRAALLKMDMIVSVVPFLFQVALFLFLAGLVLYTAPLTGAVTISCTVILALSLLFYVIPTLLPFFIFPCPYNTPLTWILSSFWEVLPGKTPHNRNPAAGSFGRRDEGVEGNEADQNSPAVRDRTSMLWLVKSCNDPGEFEKVTNAIPDLLEGSRDGNVALVNIILETPDFCDRIVRFVGSNSPTFSEALGVRSCITGLSALWSILRLLCEPGPHLRPPLDPQLLLITLLRLYANELRQHHAAVSVLACHHFLRAATTPSEAGNSFPMLRSLDLPEVQDRLESLSIACFPTFHTNFKAFICAVGALPPSNQSVPDAIRSDLAHTALQASLSISVEYFFSYLPSREPIFKFDETLVLVSTTTQWDARTQTCLEDVTRAALGVVSGKLKNQIQKYFHQPQTRLGRTELLRVIRGVVMGQHEEAAIQVVDGD